MSRFAFLSIAAVLMTGAANAAEPIALRDMGSFHVGGRLVEISGKPVKEMVFTSGGVPAKVDPNGTYQVEQMYVQYFLPANEHGAYPFADRNQRQFAHDHDGQEQCRGRGPDRELAGRQGPDKLDNAFFG